METYGNHVNVCVCVDPAFVQPTQPSKHCSQCGEVLDGEECVLPSLLKLVVLTEEFDKAWWQRKRKYEAGHPTDHGRQLLRHRNSTE